MKEITVGELKQILSQYPNNFKVVIPVHGNVGIDSPLSEVRQVDYDSVGNGFGESSFDDGNCRPLVMEDCNAIYLVPYKEIDFDIFSGDDKEINEYLKKIPFA